MKLVNQITIYRSYGLSIIEVLTSVVVAMIGVFGILVLIPFAVKQAHVGLDKDASVIMARNAYSQFEVEGYRLPTNWGLYRGGTNISAYSPFAIVDSDNDGFPDDINGDSMITDEFFPAGDKDPPAAFSIDPLGILENLPATPTAAQMTTAFNKAWFPFNAVPAGSDLYPSGTGPVDLRIAPVTLGTADGSPMSLAAARRMFASTDELIFGDAADELLGPEQVFDLATNSGGSLVPARRQKGGRLSWSAIVVPFKDDPLLTGTQRWSYQMYILVYKDREVVISAPTLVPPVATASTSDEQMIYAKVNDLTTGISGLNSPVTNVQLQPSVTTVQGQVNRDDWVMMINQSSTAEPGFNRQIAFYRVVNVVDADATNPVMLTLDGPDFRFDDGSSTFSDTYIVHLKNVVGVYERSFESEFESIWTTRGN